MKKLKFFIVVLMFSKCFASNSDIENIDYGSPKTQRLESKASSPIKSLKSPSRKPTIDSENSTSSYFDDQQEYEKASPLAPTKKRSRLSEDFFEIEENFIKFKDLNHNDSVNSSQSFGILNFQDEKKVVTNLLYRFCSSENLKEILTELNIGAYLKKDSGSYLDLLNVIEKVIYLTPKDFLDTAINCRWESIILLNKDGFSMKKKFIQNIDSISIKNQQNGARYFNLYTHNKEIYDLRLEKLKELLSSK